MQILTIILYAYLGIGSIYALYILFFGNGSFLWLPLNILGGPIALIAAIINTRKQVKKFENPGL